MNTYRLTLVPSVRLNMPTGYTTRFPARILLLFAHLSRNSTWLGCRTN